MFGIQFRRPERCLFCPERSLGARMLLQLVMPRLYHAEGCEGPRMDPLVDPSRYDLDDPTTRLNWEVVASVAGWCGLCDGAGQPPERPTPRG